MVLFLRSVLGADVRHCTSDARALRGLVEELAEPTLSALAVVSLNVNWEGNRDGHRTRRSLFLELSSGLRGIDEFAVFPEVIYVIFGLL